MPRPTDVESVKRFLTMEWKPKPHPRFMPHPQSVDCLAKRSPQRLTTTPWGLYLRNHYSSPEETQTNDDVLEELPAKDVYRKGQEMYITDTLSRAYLSLPNHILQNELKFIRSVEEVNMTKHLAVTRECLPDFNRKLRMMQSCSN